MSLADRVKDGPPVSLPGKPCSVGLLLRDLPADESAALRAMLDLGSGWSTQALLDTLTDEGHVSSRNRIERHRGGHCSCKARGLA